MFARRRACVVASRLSIARPRAVASFVRYSTESTQPATSTPPPSTTPAQSYYSDAASSNSPSSTPPEGSSVPNAEPPAASAEPLKAAPAKPFKAGPLRAKPRAKVVPKAGVKPAPKPATPPSGVLFKPEPSFPAQVQYHPKPAPVETATTSFSHAPINAPASVIEAQTVGQVAEINWENSYYGASVQPVTEEQFNILMRPLKAGDIEIKPDGVIYLPEIKYRRRLNEAFGPMGWCLIPRGEAVIGESIVTREYALIINGRFVSQSQGENNYFGADQLPSAVEGCKSNALMRCCKDLGIASELWDPIYPRWFKKTFMKEVWVEHQVTKKKRTLWFHRDQVQVNYPYKLAQ